jgi:hypothetical protein
MRGKVDGSPYDFGDDFKNLPPKQRTGLIETARGLLKIQKKTRAITVTTSETNTKKDRQALPEE